MSGNDWLRSYRRRREEKREKRRDKYSPHHRACASPVPEPAHPLCPLDLSDDLVTVSVPVYKTPLSLLERAVASILGGSHKHVRVVVISDGDGRKAWNDLSPKLRQDPRCVAVCSPGNWGPYFNHDVVLRATPGPFFAVQDSDDLSSGRRLERQLSTLHDIRAEAVHSPIYQRDQKGATRLVRGTARAGEVWAHRADHFGLYSVRPLLELGGYHAGFRVGYDSNITSFLNLLARTAMTEAALYTRHERPASLTLDPATGYRSKMREALRAQLKAMWGRVFRATRRSRRSGVDEARATALSRTSKHGDIGLRDALVDEVRERLAEVETRPPPLGAPHLRRVLTACEPDAASRSLAESAYRHCEETRPSKVTALGTPAVAGIALYGARFGADVLCLDTDPAACAEVNGRLSAVGLGRQLQQTDRLGAAPGLLIVGDDIDLEGRELAKGTEVWMASSRAEAAAALGQIRSSSHGMLRVVVT